MRSSVAVEGWLTGLGGSLKHKDQGAEPAEELPGGPLQAGLRCRECLMTIRGDDLVSLAPLGYRLKTRSGVDVSLAMDGNRMRGTRKLPGRDSVEQVDQVVPRMGFIASASDLVPLAAGLEAGLGHPLARGIARAAAHHGLVPAPVTDTTVEPGRGVRGRLGGDPVAIGSPEWLASDAPLVAEGGTTPLVVTRGGRPIGILWLVESPQAGATGGSGSAGSEAQGQAQRDQMESEAEAQEAKESPLEASDVTDNERRDRMGAPTVYDGEATGGSGTTMNKDTMANVKLEKVEGTIQSASANTIAIIVPDKNNQVMRFQANQQVQVMKDDKPVALKDLKAGDEVRASYQMDPNGQMMLKSIEVEKLSAQHPGEPKK